MEPGKCMGSRGSGGGAGVGRWRPDEGERRPAVEVERADGARVELGVK